MSTPGRPDPARDPGLYPWRPWARRHQVEWPGGARVAVWVAPNLEYYEIDPPAHPQRRAWARPHPDVVGFGHRDHGNRVGHWRMAEAMSANGFPGSVSLSVALCQHHPEIVADAAQRGWEFFSHGIYNTRYAYGMSEDQERAIIEDSISTVLAATGQHIRGWLAPALTHTPRTLELLAEHGLTYSCDLYHDDQPTELTLASGRPLMAIPYSLEINDHYGFNVYNMTPRGWAQALVDQFRRLAEEGSAVMCIPLHAYLVGQPHRIGPFAEALAEIAADGRAWPATASAICDWWRAHARPADADADAQGAA